MFSDDKNKPPKTIVLRRRSDSTENRISKNSPKMVILRMSDSTENRISKNSPFRLSCLRESSFDEKSPSFDNLYYGFDATKFSEFQNSLNNVEFHKFQAELDHAFDKLVKHVNKKDNIITDLDPLIS